MPVDLTGLERSPHFGHGPGTNTIIRRQGSEAVLQDVKENHSADACPGSSHSTELDVVDMHVQRLALEVISDEDACSSINIVLSQTSDRAAEQPEKVGHSEKVFKRIDG